MPVHEELFAACNHIIGISSLPMACNLKIWCKWPPLIRVLDITD